MILHTVWYESKELRYPIYVGNDLLADKSLFRQHIPDKQLMIVTNETIAPLYLAKLRSVFADDLQCDCIILPDGEQYKNLSSFTSIIDKLIAKRHSHSTTLVALGGGVIGDITGFAAHCYKRGVNLIQIPTSLLAQVDAAIGGKTGINQQTYKNYIGAFHQPKAVFCDLSLLKTLQSREFVAGIAELLKYGLGFDKNFFDYLEQNLQLLLNQDLSVMQEVVTKAAELKVKIVSQDETDKGVRNYLNLGHTFAHAIEAATSQERFLHGEAVALGLVMALTLSSKLCALDASVLARLIAVLKKAGLPYKLPKDINSDLILSKLQMDKKFNNKNKFILLKEIAKIAVVLDVDESLVKDSIQGTT